MERNKDKITFLISVLTLAGILAGYGIWVGNISTKVDKLEKRTEKLETTLDTKIDGLVTNINQLTVQTAVLSEKVDQLKKEISNNEK
jgi:outer membrane murein-binding lipoprotein Lpp